MDNFDIKNLVLDRVKTIYWYETICSDCGYKNHPNNLANFCPKCGKNLKVGEGREVILDE